MLVGEFQLQFAQPGLGRDHRRVAAATAAAAHHGIGLGADRLGRCLELLLEHVVAQRGVLHALLELGDRAARGFQARHAVVRGQQVHVPGAELGTLGLGQPQLLFVLSDLLIEELPRVLHVGAVGAGLALDEDGQELLHHVVGQLGAGVAVGDGEQVAGLRGDLDALGQAEHHALHVRRAGDLQFQIGLGDQLFEVGPAEGRVLEHVELADHGAFQRDAAQQRRQHRVGVDIDTRGGLVLIGNRGHGEPAGDAQHPGDGDREPALAPQPEGEAAHQ